MSLGGKLMGKRFFDGFRSKSPTCKMAKYHQAMKYPIHKGTSLLDMV